MLVEFIFSRVGLLLLLSLVVLLITGKPMLSRQSSFTQQFILSCAQTPYIPLFSGNFTEGDNFSYSGYKNY